MKRPTVILRSCPTYDVPRIHALVREGLETLNLRPYGRTLVKPNCVASGRHFPHAFTRPEFLEGVLRALKDRARPDLSEMALGERCGITVPTRFAFKEAGYYAMLDRVQGVKPIHFEECSQVEIPLYHPGRLRDSFFTPDAVARADFFVNCPKFKAHPWTTVTFSLKSYIGIQDDRHRLIDHDHKLNEKVADLQYIIQPQFIAIDAITAGEGRMLTPIPFDLGMVIMGDNQVAFDAVCCHIVGLDPLSVEHIRLAWERGFGPVDLSAIDIQGDVTLAEARSRAQGFRTGLIRVEDYFKGTNIRAYAGPPPDPLHDYCWGGCPGAIEEAIEIIRQYDVATEQKLSTKKRLHVVFGAYDGPIDATAEERVVFIGDCTAWKGTLAGKPVQLESIYRDRSNKHPLEATAESIFTKMVKVNKQVLMHRNDPYWRMAGCPVSVSEQVLLLVRMLGTDDPFLSDDSPSFVSCYLSTKMRDAMSRILGKPYNQPGPAHRGDARPPQNFPLQGIHAPLETHRP